ncbi:MAG TPA: phosphatase [Coriobacteriia bacterium]
MRLLADLHTHTVASGHAFSTVTELANAASGKGLELIAFTDHGPSVPGGAHFWYFWNAKVVPPRIAGVRVLAGCEANVADTDSGLDLPDEVLAGLDLVAVGFHPLTGFDEIDRARNTNALLRAMANPLVDVVTHPGNAAEFPLEADRIVAAAVEHGVALELNNHSFDPRSGRSGGRATEREFAIAARDAGAWISLGSDAHYHDQVGDLDNAIAVVEEIGFPLERIVNRDAATVLGFLNGRRSAGRPKVEAFAEVRP